MVTKKTSKKAKKAPEVEVKEEVIAAEEETKEETKEVKEEPKAEVKKNDVIGSLKGGKEVHQKGHHLKFTKISAPVHKRDLPRDIQAWLTNKGYGTNVYKESKEWLARHNVDPVMLEKLKKFINDRYL